MRRGPYRHFRDFIQEEVETVEPVIRDDEVRLERQKVVAQPLEVLEDCPAGYYRVDHRDGSVALELRCEIGRASCWDSV